MSFKVYESCIGNYYGSFFFYEKDGKFFAGVGSDYQPMGQVEISEKCFLELVAEKGLVAKKVNYESFRIEEADEEDLSWHREREDEW